MINLLGKAMKKTTGAARMVAEAAKKKPKESVVAKEKDVEKLGRLATEIKSTEGVAVPSRDGKGENNTDLLYKARKTALYNCA